MASRSQAPNRSLFFVEYGLGHKTHHRFLQQHLAADPRFDATIIPLYWLDQFGDFLSKLQIPPLRERGLDLWTWWIFQFKRQQVGYLLRRYDTSNLDLVYIHTQTAATSVLDLPRSVPAVVSIDLTWKLAFQESRYLASPFFRPTLELERRIFDRADMIVSFSDWAAASVMDDYKIPASKVQVVRNGVTLPPPAVNGHGLDASHANGHRNGHGLLNGYSLYGRNGHASASGLAATAVLGSDRNGNGAGYLNGHANGHANGNGRHDELLKLGFIGNGFMRKGGDLLLRVHQEHFADQAHLTLICGDAPRGTADLHNVDVRAQVPWDELMTSVLPGFDLFVFPTRFDYSPYAVIEAMSAGVPVLATRVGAIPEMIQDGHSGFLIEADREAPLVERMHWALSNRSQLPEMGARAKEHADGQYAAALNYPRLLDVLAGVSRSGKVLV